MSRQNSPESATFNVSVVGSEDNRLHTEGTLETTPTSLIYTDVEGSRLSWPLHLLTKFGSNGERLFTVEAGTQCPTGPGVYIFSTPHAPYLENIIVRHLSALNCSPDPDGFLSPMQNGHPPLSSRGLQPYTVSTNGNSMLKSQSLWSLPSNQFPVENLTDDPNITRGGVLEVTSQDLVFIDGSMGRRFQWPLVYLRRYGCDKNVFSIDANSKCPGGEGIFSFMCDRASELQSLVTNQSKSYYGSQMSLSSPQTTPSKAEVVKVPIRTQADDSPVFQRSNSFLRRARSAMDLTCNIYEVVNISDELKEVGKGTLEVTVADIIYIDRLTDEKWRWPLKNLRRYGCDGNVFSFEAGRRCPGGEGLYAFSCEQASDIHEAILLSISGGRQQREDRLRFASTLSLVEPSFNNRREQFHSGSHRSPELCTSRRPGLSSPRSPWSSDSRPVSQTQSEVVDGLRLSTPPYIKKQRPPLPDIPNNVAVTTSPVPVTTPPMSPSTKTLSPSRNSLVSSPSQEENDSSEVSSVSSGVTTPPPSGTSTPPPKPPRSERRAKRKSKPQPKGSNVTEGTATPPRNKPVHMYEDPNIVLQEYLDNIPTKSPPPAQVTVTPPVSESHEPGPLVDEKSKKKRNKPKPPVKNRSLMKILGKKSSGNSQVPKVKPPPVLSSGNQENLYENLSESGRLSHEALYANVSSARCSVSPRQPNVYENMSTESVSVTLSSVVPQPHRGNSPPPSHHINAPGSTLDTPSYSNVSLLVEGTDSPGSMYANMQEISNGRITSPRGTSSYAEVQFISDLLNESITKPLDLSHDGPSPTLVVQSNDPEDRVEYGRLDFNTMEALKTCQEQRVSKETFAIILDRHTKRDLENLKSSRKYK